MAAARSGRGVVGSKRRVSFVSSPSFAFEVLALVLLAVAMVMMETPAVIGAEQSGHSFLVEGDDSAAQGVNSTEKSISSEEEDEDIFQADESHSIRHAESGGGHSTQARSAFPKVRRIFHEARQAERDFITADGSVNVLRKKVRAYAGLSGAAALALLGQGLYGSVRGWPKGGKWSGGLFLLQAGMAGAAALALFGLAKSMKKKSEKESRERQAMDRIVQLRDQLTNIKDEFWWDPKWVDPVRWQEHRLDNFAHIHGRGKYASRPSGSP